MQVCRDTSDLEPLFVAQRLYLKPQAKINISVQLPSVKVHGKAISTWDLMEKLRKLIQPETFSALKVHKTSADTVRLEGEVDGVERVARAVARLDGRSVTLDAYPDALRVRAAPAAAAGPARHAWDAFFRDAPNMDEMKAGERPDTLHVRGLPTAWFVSPRDRREPDAPPCETIFSKVFEKFGRVRAVDVPAADPFRRDMKPHMTGFTSTSSDSALFEGYVQFAEYVAFVRAMEALRGMKLVLRPDGDEPVQCVDLSVDFDRTKHMTDAAVKRRAIVRERLAERQRARDEKERQDRDKESRRREADRMSADEIETRRREREARRKRKQLAQLMARERGEVRAAVAQEERRLVAAQRRLQAVRLAEELFRRLQHKQMRGGARGAGRAEEEEARERVVRRIKLEQEAELDKQRQRLQRAYEGSIVLRAVLDTRRERARSGSPGSPSSAESRSAESRVKREKPASPERDTLRLGVYPGAYSLPYALPPAAAAAYPYHAPPELLYGSAARYFQPPVPAEYMHRPRYAAPRRPRGRALYRGGPRMPYFEGPNAPHEYYKYFKRLSEQTDAWHGHDDRTRSRSRSRRRSYTRSRTRSRSRHRRHSRSRSRTRTHSRSRSRRRHRSYTRSRTRSRSHDRRRSRSRSERSRSRSRSRRRRSPSPLPAQTAPASAPQPPAAAAPARARSKSWSLPAAGERDASKAWSRSPPKPASPSS